MSVAQHLLYVKLISGLEVIPTYPYKMMNFFAGLVLKCYANKEFIPYFLLLISDYFKLIEADSHNKKKNKNRLT